MTTVASKSRRVSLPDGSRSVQSPFVWRLFVFMSLIGLGLCITLAAAGRTTFAAAWAIIAAGWFTVGMVLWRRHVRDDDAAWDAKQQANRKRS
jgi:hypothetical protein